MRLVLDMLSRAAAPGPPTVVRFAGSYNATMATLFVPSVAAANAIPNGLELRNVTGAPDGTHPVIVTFGAQSNVTAGTPLAVPLNYLESVIGIPGVGVAGDAQNRSAIFMPRLDVDNPVAAALGWATGYAKTLSSISAGAGFFAVRTLLAKAQVLALATQLSSGAGQPTDFPLFRFTADMLAQPIISVDAAGNRIFTQFNWNLGTAVLFGATAHLQVFAASLPVLAAGNYDWQSYQNQTVGAGQITSNWDLTGPYPDWP
jgi:hypothetical protein